MKTSWTLNLSEQQKAELKKEYASSPILRERLKTLLLNKMETSRTSARSKNKYDSPAWAYVQADAIGYERALDEVISLITTKTVE